MKKVLLFLIISLCFASTPEETVNKLYTDLKDSKSLASLVDYVNWDSEYKLLSEDDKKAIGVTSSSDLSEFVRKFLKSPGDVFMEKVRAQMSNVPPEQSEAMMKELTKKSQELDQAIKTFENGISQWEVKVIDSAVSGTKAVVRVKETFNGQVAERPIELVQVNGKWFLTKGGVEHFGQNMGNAGAQQGGVVPQGGKKGGAGFEF